MIKSLSENFRRSNLSLTSTFVYIEGETDAYDYATFSKYIDYISFARMYFESKYETVKYLNIFNVKQRLNNLILRGVPSTKILIDVTFMGYNFGKTTFNEFGNLLRYNEICKLTSGQEEWKWQKTYDSDWSLTYLKNHDQNENIDEIVYENQRSLANRARIAVKLNLAGVLTSSVNMDDFHGECGYEKDTYDDFNVEHNQTLYIPKHSDTTFPLLQTISDALYISQCKISPPKNQTDFQCGKTCQIIFICIALTIFAIFVISILVFRNNSYTFLGPESRFCSCCYD